jgi:NTE family protein
VEVVMTTLGMVLAGGAARGAYEAGVLRYVLTEMPKNLGFVPWPDIVSGTSVGALNGVFAVTRQEAYLRRMTNIWREMEIGHVFTLQTGGVLRTVRSMFRASQITSLLGVEPLYELARREFPRAALRESIDSGACKAFIISATRLDDGVNVLFYDAHESLALDPLPGAAVVRTHMTEQHLLASAAIPFLFPAMLIDDDYYVDGGLRQNTPLRPTLRAGADRILIVGAHGGAAVQEKLRAEGKESTPSPTLPFLAGKTLNALMLDPVERDLHTTEQINTLIAWGRENFGAAFTEKLQADLGIRSVENYFLRPSQDLGRIAAEVYSTRPPKASSQVRWLLSLIADQANRAEGESDLLSFLYFDQEYTGTLEQLGFEDARDQEEALMAFLAPTDR